MISIGNVVSVADGVRYFDEAVANTPADYYAARGEAPGVWRGSASGLLGLRGRVDREDFIRVLEGRHPATGEGLGRHHARSKNVAFDVTFSVPKSVSLLYALGDEGVRVDVMEALSAGAAAAHDYLERHAGWGRAYSSDLGGVRRLRAQVVTASFVHRTARPVSRDGVVTVDPQLHIHLVVASFVHRENGTWGQLDSPPLYAHAAAAGAVGQAATRDVLVRRLGVRVRTNANGTFEVEGFTDTALAEFSQRHRQAMAAAAAAGVESMQGQKLAVLDSRESKSEIDPGADLFAHWEERAASVGLSRDGIAGLADQEQVREIRWFDVDTVQQVVGRGEGGLTAQASVFSRRDLVRALAAHAPLGMPPAHIEGLTDAILGDQASVVPMVPRQEPGETPAAAMCRWAQRGMELHYSTPEVVALERRMLESAQRRVHEHTLVLDPVTVDAAFSEHRTDLTAGQRAMVEDVCASPAGVLIVEGAAGTGKTTAARVIHAAHAHAGVPVVGCAPSGRAAVELEVETAIPSFTTASLLARLREGQHFARGELVVADESSMLGPDLAELVLRAEQDGAKLVLIGDSRQLQPVDGGALFTSLGDSLGRVELTEVVRQQEQWDREVLMALRDGRAAPLVRRYLEAGRVHASPDQASRVSTIAADWVAATVDGHDVVAIARERAAVATLNAVTRRTAVAAGLVERGGVVRECTDLVGRREVPLGPLEFARGDRVLVVGPNRRTLGLVKGLRGIVTETRGDGSLVLDVGGSHPRSPLIVPDAYTGISHGYALTAHRAQGATADIALVHGSDAADRQWQYVALSRHRIRATYYDVAPLERDVDGVHHGHQPQRPSVEERLHAAMTRDGSKATTLDYPVAYDRQLLHTHASTRPDGDGSAAPTEAQLGVLRDSGLIDDLPPAATWVHASLLIDEVLGTPIGEQALGWLVAAGAPADEANRVVELALGDVRASRGISRLTYQHPRPDRPECQAPIDIRPHLGGGETGDADAARYRAEELRRNEEQRATQMRAEIEHGRAIGA